MPGCTSASGGAVSTGVGRDPTPESRIDKRKRELHAEPERTTADRVRASIAGGFRTLAVAAVTLFVTLFVVGMIADVMPSDGAFANESDEVEGMTGDAFVLGGVALIILVASIILYLVGGFGGGNGGNGGRGGPRM